MKILLIIIIIKIYLLPHRYSGKHVKLIFSVTVLVLALLTEFDGIFLECSGAYKEIPSVVAHVRSILASLERLFY
jgi:hypothetical protein